MKIKLRTKILIFILIGFGVVIFGFKLYSQKNQKIFAVVVPHHNLVAVQRAKLFSDLSKIISQPKTIILLSPNHYSAGRGNIQTTNQNWNVDQGKISADQNVVSFLTKNNLAKDEPSSFVYEHGIFNILADIHNNFPGAKLVPIIFNETTQGQLQALERGLEDSCKNCLMIASVDFSHYQPVITAEPHDELSIKELKELNANGIFSNTNVDSGPALSLLIMWAKSHKTLNFNLKNHTDSGSANPNVESTTHVFGWYW